MVDTLAGIEGLAIAKAIERLSARFKSDFQRIEPGYDNVEAQRENIPLSAAAQYRSLAGGSTSQIGPDLQRN